MAQNTRIRVHMNPLGVTILRLNFLGGSTPKTPEMWGRNRVSHANENAEYLENSIR